MEELTTIHASHAINSQGRVKQQPSLHNTGSGCQVQMLSSVCFKSFLWAKSAKIAVRVQK
jgi:hypothetical protein